jgi:hypothetical protein
VHTCTHAQTHGVCARIAVRARDRGLFGKTGARTHLRKARRAFPKKKKRHHAVCQKRYHPLIHRQVKRCYHPLWAHTSLPVCVWVYISLCVCVWVYIPLSVCVCVCMCMDIPWGQPWALKWWRSPTLLAEILRSERYRATPSFSRSHSYT